MPSLAKRLGLKSPSVSLSRVLREPDEEETSRPRALQGFDPSTGLWVSQGGGTKDSYPYLSRETKILVASMETKPSDAIKAVIDTAITDLISEGLWDKCDVLYGLHADTLQATTLNWKDPTRFQLVAQGSPTFTRASGVFGDGVAAHFTSGWIPATHGQRYTRDDASLFGFSLTSGQSAGNAGMLGSISTGTYRVIPRSTANFFTYTANDATSRGPANTDGAGLFGWSRTSATSTQPYKDGVAQGSPTTTASTTLPGSQLSILRATNLYFAGGCAFAGAGAAFTAGEWASLNSIIAAYRAALV